MPQEQEQENASAQDAAQNEEQEVGEAKQTMSELEEGDPPEDLADWPGGKAKYLTYAGPRAKRATTTRRPRSSARRRCAITRTAR